MPIDPISIRRPAVASYDPDPSEDQRYRREVFQQAVGAVAALGLASLSPVAKAEDPIRIGSFLSVTGPAAFLGDPELKTLELYVHQLNENGGLLGREVQLVHYDDSGDASKARTFVTRLLRQDKVDLIIGGSTTGDS